MDALVLDVRRGDLASVQARIGADRSLLNARQAVRRFTALEWAVRHGHLHITRYLVGEGAHVNEGDGSGSPALRLACYSEERQAMVELLLEAGADAVTSNEDGDTPLMCAARWGHVGIIRASWPTGAGTSMPVMIADGPRSVGPVTRRRRMRRWCCWRRERT
jgi:ankyrin repeat protein